VKRTVVADELANNIGGRSENGCIYPIPKWITFNSKPTIMS
jgi:hypothetical protein